MWAWPTWWGSSQPAPPPPGRISSINPLQGRWWASPRRRDTSGRLWQRQRNLSVLGSTRTCSIPGVGQGIAGGTQRTTRIPLCHVDRARIWRRCSFSGLCKVPTCLLPHHSTSLDSILVTAPRARALSDSTPSTCLENSQTHLWSSTSETIITFL